MKNTQAFSLAETLITLGIIGIVAGLTIPVIFSNINGAKFRSQLKKTISTLNQSALMSKAKYEFDYAATDTVCSADSSRGSKESPEEIMSFCSLLNGTLVGFTYHGKVTNLMRNSKDNNPVAYKLETRETIPDNYTNYLAYSLADGTLVAFHPEAKNCELPIGRRPVQAIFSGAVDNADLSKCVGFIDVNGVSLPNREATCSYGKNSVDAGSNCVVDNNANHLLDVYPIVFHDANVEPASGAAQFVLDSSKI